MLSKSNYEPTSIFFFQYTAQFPPSHIDFVWIKACIGKTFEIHFVSVKLMFAFVKSYLKAEINL